jgi:chaperonin GroES
MLQPLNDRVLVRCIPEPPLSAIIIMPDIARPDSTLGVIVAAGPGKRLADGTRLPLDVKVGDLVRWGPYNDFEDGDLVLIQEADIRYKLDKLPGVGSFPEVTRRAE